MKEKALNLWCILAEYNMKSDFFVNDLLEDIAGEKYMTENKSDDPIVDTIRNLTNSECRKFIQQAEEYRAKHHIPLAN